MRYPYLPCRLYINNISKKLAESFSDKQQHGRRGRKEGLSTVIININSYNYRPCQSNWSRPHLLLQLDGGLGGAFSGVEARVME